MTLPGTMMSVDSYGPRKITLKLSKTEFTLCLFLCVFLETVSDFVALVLALNSGPSYFSILSSGIMDVDLLIL